MARQPSGAFASIEVDPLRMPGPDEIQGVGVAGLRCPPGGAVSPVHYEQCPPFHELCIPDVANPLPRPRTGGYWLPC